MFLAFDIGGTHTKFAVIDAQGHILKKDHTATPKRAEEFLTFINKTTQHVQEQYAIKGIAMSTPGAVSDDGMVYGSSAVPYIHTFNLKQRIQDMTHLPVELENDANCAALAEVWKGAAQGKKDVAVVVLGTGVGGAIIKDGALHKGANLHAGEFGYMILQPNHLGKGMNTFSELASTSSIIRRVARKKGVPETSLTGEDVFQKAEEGDDISSHAIQEFYQMLAVGLYNIQYMYDPEIILIGGGISRRDDLITKLNGILQKTIEKINVAKISVNVTRCHYSADANLVGAVYHFIKQSHV